MSGLEWIIEAYGCNPAALSNLDKLRALFARLIENLSLKPVGEPVWHQFPVGVGTGLRPVARRQAGGLSLLGGITGMCLLAESHLTCHTFPEYGSLCLNLFCCRPRPFWDPSAYLQNEFAATRVRVRQVERPYQESEGSVLRAKG